MTTVGLLFTLVLIFMGQSEVILENPIHIVYILEGVLRFMINVDCNHALFGFNKEKTRIVL